jgi:3-deoxy-D-manno-octulosonic-acid transferase
MMHLLYNLVLIVATPAIALYLWLKPRHRKLLARFNPALPTFSSRPIWVQAASVGEVLTARFILKGIKKEFPNSPILLTTGTITGMAEALNSSDEYAVAWFPFDHPWTVRRFFNKVNPCCVVLIETEIWPNVLHRAHKRNTPVAIVNGRLSERNYGSYLRHKSFFATYLQHIALAAMQTPLDAARIQGLGVPAATIAITGNVKFDGADFEIDPLRRETLKKELGFKADQEILVVGSTRPGEEALFSGIWGSIQKRFPDLRLIVAPRHLQRLEEATGPFSEETIFLRSALKLNPRELEPGSIVFLDTLGELKALYSLATVAVVGGSFSALVQGHNPIEPSALGVPTVFGPHMKNFIQPAAILTDCGGARQVADADELRDTIIELLEYPERRQEMGIHAQEAIRQNQGAIACTLEHLKIILY